MLKPGLTLQFCFLTLWPIVVSGDTLRETHWGGKKLISIQLPWAAWSLTRADGSLLGTLPHDFQEAEGSGLHLPLITVVSDVLYSKWCTLSRQGSISRDRMQKFISFYSCLRNLILGVLQTGDLNWSWWWKNFAKLHASYLVSQESHWEWSALHQNLSRWNGFKTYWKNAMTQACLCFSLDNIFLS